MRWVSLSVVLLSAWRSEASCISMAEQCFCVGASRSAIARTSELAPFSATVSVESVGAGYQVSQSVSVPPVSGDELNRRWVLYENDAGVSRAPVDANGRVSCLSGANPEVVMPASGLIGAWEHGTCDRSELAKHGYVDPPCNDVARGCAAAPGAFVGLALLLALRRRRSAG